MLERRRCIYADTVIDFSTNFKELTREYYEIEYIPYRRKYYGSLDYYGTLGDIWIKRHFFGKKSTFWGKIWLKRQFLSKKFEYNDT